VSTKSNSEFEKTRAIGHIVAKTLRAVREGVRPGVTTGELNQIGKRILARKTAPLRTAPALWLSGRGLDQHQ